MEKKNFQRLIYMWMEKKVKKAIVYNTKEGERKVGLEDSKIIALGHIRGYFLYILTYNSFLLRR